MKAIIFAGGTGTRLWPLSRKKSPKQFEKLINNNSTLQLAVERLHPLFSPKDIFIATNIAYKKIVQEQLSKIPKENFIFEPEKKDVAPAIALVSGIFRKKNPKEPMVILWSDHLVKKVDLFKKILKNAGDYIAKNPKNIIFISNKPRYPSSNLGYIHIGGKAKTVNGTVLYSFEGLKYKPDEETAKTFFKSGRYAWNLGYFVTTPDFICEAFSRFAPNISENTKKILDHYGQKDYQEILKKNYGKVESINFDHAILENLDKKEAMVVMEDIGWSDVGAWEALKEALETHQYENIIRGRVHIEHVRDSLIYNYEDSKLVVGIDLDENIIVNTNDVILIAKKNSISKLQRLVKSFEGTENEKLM